jgi:hypothetical protein
MKALTSTLIDEIKAAPESVQRELLDFLAFLKNRDGAQRSPDDLMSLAHPAWEKDWNTPEEDEACRDL